jgi:hypothetical protein
VPSHEIHLIFHLPSSIFRLPSSVFRLPSSSLLSFLVPQRSAQAAAWNVLFHVDDGHHLKFIAKDTVDHPIRAFMHLTQAGVDEFMNGMPSGGHFGSAFYAGNQALDLQSRVVLRVTSDEFPDGMKIAPRLR